jgi:hypothetical protein
LVEENARLKEQLAEARAKISDVKESE